MSQGLATRLTSHGDDIHQGLDDDARAKGTRLGARGLPPLQWHVHAAIAMSSATQTAKAKSWSRDAPGYGAKALYRLLTLRHSPLAQDRRRQARLVGSRLRLAVHPGESVPAEKAAPSRCV